MTRMGSFGALSDLTVIDLTQMLAGPYATMMLADHGALVIKVEPPDGDMTRAAGPYRATDEVRALGGYMQSINRNKRSVCIDLKSEEGKVALKALVKDADAVVENFRAGVMDRLGLGYEVLREINPRLVYGSLRGFGDPRTGLSPYNDWPAFDVVAQAMGGVMSITGPAPNCATKVGPGVGDIVPGIMLAFGLVAAMFNARQTGTGQFVDISMIDSILALCERTVWQHSVAGETPSAEGNHHPFLCPFGIFPTADGFVTIAAHMDAFFCILCKELDASDLSADARFASRDLRTSNRLALVSELSARTCRFTKADLVERLGGKIPFGPVLSIREIASDPHFAAREMIVDVEQPGCQPIQIAGVPVKMTKTPGRVATRSPLLGEHTDECLRAAGLSSADIAKILRQNATTAPAASSQEAVAK